MPRKVLSVLAFERPETGRVDGERELYNLVQGQQRVGLQAYSFDTDSTRAHAISCWAEEIAGSSVSLDAGRMSNARSQRARSASPGAA